MFPLYSHSVSLSPHRSHLLIIFRPVKWPPFWCLQVSGGRSLAARQFISPARMPPASLFMLFTLCKEAGAKHHIYSCQVLFLLLMLQSYSDAILHRRPPPFLCLCVSQFLKALAALSGCFHVSCLASVLISNSNYKHRGCFSPSVQVHRQ